MGLENVRGRLRALHGDRARVDIVSSPAAYQVRIFIPWAGAAAPPAPVPPPEGAEVHPGPA
jgi:hypothetical protein